MDTEAGGFMHFTAGLRYAERAEAGLRRSLGILEDWADYPRRAVEADYHVMPRFEDELEARIRLDSIGRTSISWAWEIVRDTEICIEGRHTVVHVDQQDRPQAVPKDVRAALEALPGA